LTSREEAHLAAGVPEHDALVAGVSSQMVDNLNASIHLARCSPISSSSTKSSSRAAR